MAKRLKLSERKLLCRTIQIVKGDRAIYRVIPPDAIADIQK
jgi:hypothetical protein